MCSIIGSYSKETFTNLVKLNEYRGVFSYSLSFFPIDGSANVLSKGFGKFPLELLDRFEKPGYFLGHCQAPTNGLIEDYDRIHPCAFKPNNSDYNMYLLHNGIIKPDSVDNFNKKLNSDYQWDTQALAEYINNVGLLTALNEVEGSFACVMFNHIGSWLKLFRNEISPLFVDDELNISSTRFKNSTSIDHNTFYHLDIQNKTLDKSGEFNNTYAPYYIPF